MKATFFGKFVCRINLLLAGMLFGFAGCSIVPEASTDPTRFFVLTGSVEESEDVGKSPNALSIGLKAVGVAPYLRRPMIAVRQDPNELSYDDYKRWAEPLEAGISRIVEASLRASPVVGRVYAYPFPFEQTRDYDIALNIIRCEGVKDGQAVARFAAVVEITTGGDDAKVVARKVFQAPDAAWDGKDYAALATALSNGVAALGDDLLASLPVKK